MSHARYWQAEECRRGGRLGGWQAVARHSKSQKLQVWVWESSPVLQVVKWQKHSMHGSKEAKASMVAAPLQKCRGKEPHIHSSISPGV